MLKQEWSWTNLDFGHLSYSFLALDCLFTETFYYIVRKIGPIYLRHCSQVFLLFVVKSIPVNARESWYF